MVMHVLLVHDGDGGCVFGGGAINEILEWQLIVQIVLSLFVIWLLAWLGMDLALGTWTQACQLDKHDQLPTKLERDRDNVIKFSF